MADNEEVVTIRFACSDWRQAEFESLAADFHAQNPSIRVEILTVEDIVAGDHENSIHRLVTAADTAFYSG